MIPANYEGLITSLNLRRIENYQNPKEYPPNFQGLVDAILDLNWGQANTGTQPPTWDQANEEFSTPPSEGAIWFDTRQGRLMVYAHGDWYQANGGDGYASVLSTNAPTTPLEGQFWLEFLSKNLYVYDGSSFVPVKSEDTITKDQMETVLNNSTDFASFKTNMLALVQS